MLCLGTMSRFQVVELTSMKVETVGDASPKSVPDLMAYFEYLSFLKVSYILRIRTFERTIVGACHSMGVEDITIVAWDDNGPIKGADYAVVKFTDVESIQIEVLD